MMKPPPTHPPTHPVLDVAAREGMDVQFVMSELARGRVRTTHPPTHPPTYHPPIYQRQPTHPPTHPPGYHPF